MRLLLLAAAVAGLALACSVEHRIAVLDGAPTGVWHFPGHAFRIPLRLDNSLQRNDELVDFPVLVTLLPHRLDASRAAEGGRDLRFVDPESGAILPHQIELWNPVRGSLVWVGVPRIPAGSSDRVVYLYFGDPAAEDGQDGAAVFRAGYVAVLHLDPGLADSTASGNDGVDQGSEDTAGPVGRGRRFSGLDSIAIGVDNFPVGAGPRTMCGFASTEDVDGSAHDIVAYGGGDAGFYLLQHAHYLRCGGPTRVGAAGVFERPGVARYVCCRFDGATASLFVDGVPTLGPDPVPDWSGLVRQSAHIGGSLAGGTQMGGFRGTLDEIRVSSVARSDDWIRAEHRTLTDAFVVYGAIEQRP